MERSGAKLCPEGRLLDFDTNLMGGPQTVLKEVLIDPGSPGEE